MTIKTIGLTLLTADSAGWLTEAACALARPLDGHLIGVHAAEPVIPYTTAMAFDPVVAPQLLDWQVEEAQAIRDAFEAAAQREGIAAEFRGQASGATGAEPFLIDALRACDLILSPQLGRSAWDNLAQRLQEQVIRQSGRPVLVLPQGRILTGPVRHLALGLSPTREATRAAHDALLLAAPGAAVDLISVTEDAQPGRLSFDFRQDLAAALARLGYAVTLVERDGGAGTAGEVLLAAAAERGADLVATGAFGHSRAYDFVIGAATSHLLAKAELPVLFSK